MVDEQRIRNAVKVVMDPELKKSLLDLGMIRDIHVENSLVRLTLALTPQVPEEKSDDCGDQTSGWRVAGVSVRVVP